MKHRLFWFWQCVLLIVPSCASNPPAHPPPVVPEVRTFGVTVRDSVGTVLEPSGIISADSGELIIGINHDGRLQFSTTATGGGYIKIEAEGYQTVVARIILQDMDDIMLPLLIQPMQRLRIEGRQIFTVEGQPFVWRFVSGFRLVDYVADDNEAAAVAFLDWAQQTGFNGVRVLSSLCCWFDLTPEDGQRAVPRLLELAQARGLYLEVVALAGTKPRGLDKAAMASHVRAIGLICEASPACAAIELANENSHESQQDALTDLAFLKTLRGLVSASVPVSLGSNCCGQSDEKVIYDGGDYVTVHTDRSRPTWDRTRHIRELELVSANSKRFVVDDEPKGAGDVDSGSRSTNQHEFYGRGVLSRVFSVGATFHMESGLQAAIPSEIQQASAEAFISGTQIVPDDVRLTFQNATWSTSPVKGAHFASFGAADSVVRAYSGIGALSILALIGVSGDPKVEYQGGWKAGRVLADRPGIRVLELVR